MGQAGNGNGRETDGGQAERPFAAWLQGWMKGRYSQFQLADELIRAGAGANRNALQTRISAWTTGKVDPSAKYLELIAEVAGVDHDYLLGLVGFRSYVEDGDEDPAKQELIALIRAGRFSPKEARLLRQVLLFMAQEHVEADGTSAEG